MRKPIEELRALHVGGYWRGENDMVRQMMLGLRAAGAQVAEYSTDEHRDALDTEAEPYDRGTTAPVWLRWSVLAEVVADVAPDLIICNAGGLAFRPHDAARLRQNCCLLGIALSDPDVFEPSTRHLAGTFDTFLTNSPELVPRYRALGVDADVLPIATNEEFFRPVPARPEMRCEVLILGRAHPDRVEPVRALVKAFDTHVYGEGWRELGIADRGFVYGDDALAALASAAVTPVFFLTAGGHALVKVGLFDFLAAGALVATNTFAGVEPYLRYGKEVLGFRSTSELIGQVRWALESPAAAARVRQAGRARVLREHTWRVAWPRIVSRLQAGRWPAQPGLSGWPSRARRYWQALRKFGTQSS